MIESVTFKNFKSLRDATLELGRLTALVGANGCGKSTALLGVRVVMESLGMESDSIRALVTRRVSPAPLEGLCAAGPSPANGWLIDLRGHGIEWAAEFVIERTPNPFKSIGRVLKTELGRADRVLSLRLDPGILASPSPATIREPTMDDRGAGLATLLHHLAAARDERLDSIEADMREVVPTFKRVYTTSAAVPSTGHAGFTLDIGFEGIGRVPASHVSEGSLLALGLLSSLHMEGADLVLFDDADRALHPVAQYRLVEILYKVLERRPELQVVLTTHSLDLVNACRAEDVRVMGMTPEGTKIRKLTEHPEAARWLDVLRPGEMWSSVGESWVGESWVGEAP